MDFIRIFDRNLYIDGLMDFIFVVIFFLLVAAGVYQRMLDSNAKKNAPGKQRPPLHEVPRSFEADKPLFEMEEPPLYVYKEKEEKSPERKKKKKTERKRAESLRMTEEKKGEKEDRHPLAALRNASEARRAFIYSEIFRRKYE